eukprot:14827750-Heterocapsa_arctica.AAC.1
MEAWNFPKWVRRALLATIIGRSVRSVIAGTLSFRRRLARGLGMGGPASPFLWNLAYDPIACSLRAAAGIIPPTYVDDLAALAHGAEYAMRAEVCLVVAGKLAGLHTDNHHCSW